MELTISLLKFRNRTKCTKHINKRNGSLCWHLTSAERVKVWLILFIVLVQWWKSFGSTGSSWCFRIAQRMFCTFFFASQCGFTHTTSCNPTYPRANGKADQDVAAVKRLVERGRRSSPPPWRETAQDNSVFTLAFLQEEKSKNKSYSTVKWSLLAALSPGKTLTCAADSRPPPESYLIRWFSIEEKRNTFESSSSSSPETCVCRRTRRHRLRSCWLSCRWPRQPHVTSSGWRSRWPRETRRWCCRARNRSHLLAGPDVTVQKNYYCQRK